MAFQVRKRKRSQRTLVAALSFAAIALTLVHCTETALHLAPSRTPDQLFGLAQYESDGQTRLAIHVEDRLYDLERLNSLLSRGRRWSRTELPSNMLDLISAYDELRPRLHQIANSVRPGLEGLPAVREALLDPDAINFLPPVTYPWNLLNVAVNYRRPGEEMGRRMSEEDHLDDPYVFAKSPKATMIGAGHPVTIPPGRDRIDWEVELAVVIGRKATRVSREDAPGHVFGYTLLLDISDRGPGNRQNPRFDTDWFAGKSRDGFAPIGPFIVPVEFVPDPNNLNLKLWVNGELKQDSNSSYMINDVWDLIAFITSVQTLEPGDIIATGTPSGVGAGREPPEFLESGDTIVAEIEGISRIETPVR